MKSPSSVKVVEAAPAVPVVPVEHELVRIYNRSRKPYTHGQHVSAPNSFVTIPRWLADKWLAMFPDDFLPGDSALTAINPGQAEHIKVIEKNKALENEKKVLEEELARLRGQISGRPPLG